MRLFEAKIYFHSLKSCETISAISLSFTATLNGITLDALREWNQRLNMQIRVPVVIDANDLIC